MSFRPCCLWRARAPPVCLDFATVRFYCDLYSFGVFIGVGCVVQGFVKKPLLSSRTASMARFPSGIKGEGRHRQDPSLVSIEEAVVGASSNVAYQPILVIREFAVFSGNLLLQSEAGVYLS